MILNRTRTQQLLSNIMVPNMDESGTMYTGILIRDCNICVTVKIRNGDLGFYIS